MEVLVIGLGVTGEALARHAARRGWTAVVVEDAPGAPGYEQRVAVVEAGGGRVVPAPRPRVLAELVAAADVVVPSPGVPPGHPVYAAARRSGTRLVSEIELGWEEAQVPLVAVTGTNGKTTVTSLVTSMLSASGLRAGSAGNIGRPLVDVVGEDLDVVVVEVSSFQLQHTERFRPRVAVLLNLAPDHFDWHPSFAHYRAAKAKVFANQDGEDVLVASADDPEVAALAGTAPARVVRFSVEHPHRDVYRVESGALCTPRGELLLPVAELPRSHPHDLANALAAAAAALEAGATAEGVANALRAFPGLPHRLTLVGEAGGVRYYDDSKATNPHATLHALAGFDSVVLIAGGRNKGLDLGPLREASDRIRAVVAIGEAVSEIEAVFAGVRPVHRASSMRQAVATAANLAREGDAVLLSPACASFDAYPNYAARGDDFTAEVQALLAGSRRGTA